MNGFQDFSIADLFKQVMTNPGVLSDPENPLSFLQGRSPMNTGGNTPIAAPSGGVPAGVGMLSDTNQPVPTAPPPQGSNATPPQGPDQSFFDKIGLKTDNFGNRLGNALLAAGSTDPAAAMAKLQEADTANSTKYQNISGTPYFWYYDKSGKMAVVDENGKPVEGGALGKYLQDKAAREVELWKNKTDYKAAADVNAAGQKLAGKTALEQAGELAGSSNQANELRAIASELGQTSGDRVPATGGVAGAVQAVLPNAAASVVMPQSTKLRQDAERIIQNSLRATLGAQFTEKEGTRFLERAYNPALPVADNVKRLNQMADELDLIAQNKQAATDYMKAHGSLEGFKPGVQSNAGGSAKRVSSEDEWAALPAGTQYIGPDGKTRVKR